MRRRENASRGYVEIKTPLIYDKALWETSGHWSKFRENMFLIPMGEDQTYAIKPMNCPGHMLLFGLFDLKARAEFSTRPENKLGTDEEWDFSEGELQAALERHSMKYVVGEGEGSFYAPKIDLHVTDALGRSWQLGTIQLDRQMPQRFGLTYMGADNVEHEVYVIHRAFFGSFERFIGILTEHYAGAFPFWISPEQIRIVPVGESHRPAALALAERLPYRVHVDQSDDTVGKRIRNAEVEKIPYVVVYGDKESDDSLAIREHGGAQETLSLQDFQAKLATLAPWQAGA
jgi:threonyl-tRNA synthetase